MIVQIVRNEGIQGLYKGMSASYLGVAEGTIQWALYEQFKAWGAGGSANDSARKSSLSNTISAAGTAKLIASLITYPHEVLRTREEFERLAFDCLSPEETAQLASTLDRVAARWMQIEAEKRGDDR